MHEVGFEPTNSKRRGLKPRAFDHFATHAKKNFARSLND